MTDIWESSVIAGMYGGFGILHGIIGIAAGAYGGQKRIFRVGISNLIGHWAMCLGMILVFYGINSELSRWLSHAIGHAFIYYVVARAYSLKYIDAIFTAVLMGGAFFMPFLSVQLLGLEARYLPFAAAVAMYVFGLLSLWVRCDKRYLWSLGFGFVYFGIVALGGALYGLGYVASPLLYDSWSIETIYTYYFWMNTVVTIITLGLGTMGLALLKSYYPTIHEMMLKYRQAQDKKGYAKGSITSKGDHEV